MTDPVTGASRGFGFVRFSNETDSLRALIEMQGVYIAPLDGQSSGRPLRVCPATPKNKSPVNGSAYEAELLAKAYSGGAGGGPRGFPPGQASTYNPAGRPDPYAASQHVAALGNLPQALQLLQAQAARSRDGSPASAHGLPRDPYGSPMAPTSPHAASAAAMTSSALDPNNTTVFVGGLSSLISEDTLRTFFVPFGEIAYVKIPPGKGCGFVQFVRKVDAERAIERMQGFPIGGGRIRLSWGRSQGDKAAAAAAHAATQAAQLGQLASLAGLGGLSASQLAQLAGLSSALSAVQQQQTGSGAALPNSLGHSAELEANSALLHQLAAASVGLVNQAPGSSPTTSFADHLHYRSSTQPGLKTPGANDSRETELLRSVYAGLSPHLSSNGSHQPHQQLQSQQHPHHAPHQSGYPSLHQQINHVQQERSAADHLTSALSNMDLRREENARTYYQSGEMPSSRDGPNRGFAQQSQSPSPAQQAWQHRNGGEDPSQQHRASPHSMLKASTFAPFSPAESPVVAEATLAPESGPHNPTTGNRQSSSLSTTSSQTLQQQQQQQQQHRHPHQM